MPLLSSLDRQRLQDQLSVITRPVRLLLFTQAIGCETCVQTRQIVDELPALSDKIAVEEVNLVLAPERAKAYGVDRAPTIVLTYLDPAVSNQPQDARIRFVGAPSGYEFISLVEAVLLAGGRPLHLTEDSLKRLAVVDRPVTLQVFTTPTCPNCPRAVTLAHEMACANPNIHSYAVEATEFPDLVRRFRVNGVPKTVVDNEIEILGALPEDAFIDEALAQFRPSAPSAEARGPER